MSRARKCDRCGTLYEPCYIELKRGQGKFNSLKLIDIDLDNKYYSTDTKDLCPACLGSFKAWFNMEVPK